MRQRIMGKATMIIVLFAMLLAFSPIFAMPVEAKEFGLEGMQYQFDSDSKYVLKKALSKEKINGKTQYGEIKLEGNLSSLGNNNGFQVFEVSAGNVTIKYNIDVSDKITIKEDKVKKVSNVDLDSNILTGAVIVQTSQDGEKWIVDKLYTDVLNEKSGYNTSIYQSNYVQQANGCYIRVLIAYETEKILEEKNLLFIDTSDYEKTRWAEVYKFYLIDKESGNAGSVNTTPRMVFQDSETRVKTEKNNGYKGQLEETIEDPHYGWSLGEFTINGYTDSDKDSDNTPVFLKNVGDQVTLWFTLKQDINKLNGNDKLTINEDKKGWDDYFKTNKTNFKKGTLIIRQTDAEGSAKDPIIYTNYLEANVRTGADTKVRLFEEGDYEVALDYEIKDSDGIDSVTDYRLYFKFKIRNSNCMIFPFDLSTQSELTDRSIAEDGFRLDYANSKYLDVYVEQKNVNFNGTSYSEDTRGNKSAKDGAEYTAEGIYVISVQHDYNGSRTTDKTIFVGNTPIIKALSRNNITIADINNFLAQGYKIDNDGCLVSYTGEELETEEVTEETEEIINDSEENISQVDEKALINNNTQNIETHNEPINNENSTSKPTKWIFIIIVVGGLALFFKTKKINEAQKADCENKDIEEQNSEENAEIDRIEEDE